MNILNETEQNKEPIEKFVSFKTLHPIEHKHLEDVYKKNNILKDNTTYFGIEMEIENITNCPLLEYYWNIHEDGSLRNNGIEFTSNPLQGKQIVSALHYLKNALLLSKNKPSFSGRCSTHIHINVRDLSWINIYCFVLLYAIFEKHFFNLAGTKREENIFCVPLYKSTQLYCIHGLKDYLYSWSKYNAINLGPILGSDYSHKYGTIEFRHLFGTLDINTIVSWVNNINKLKEACKKEKLTHLIDKIFTLNSTSEYLQLYKKIFQEEAKINLMSKLDFESCITNTKLALLSEHIPPVYIMENSHFYKTINSKELPRTNKKYTLEYGINNILIDF